MDAWRFGPNLSPRSNGQTRPLWLAGPAVRRRFITSALSLGHEVGGEGCGLKGMGLARRLNFNPVPPRRRAESTSVAARLDTCGHGILGDLQKER